VRLTERGTATYQAMVVRQEAWADRLVGGLERTDLETTARMLGELCRRLEAELRDQRKDDDDGNEQ
jgi:hypothetical protein